MSRRILCRQLLALLVDRTIRELSTPSVLEASCVAGVNSELNDAVLALDRLAMKCRDGKPLYREVVH